MRELVTHVVGPRHLLSSYNGHLALPGGSTRFHTDQWWMPPPTNARAADAAAPRRHGPRRHPRPPPHRRAGQAPARHLPGVRVQHHVDHRRLHGRERRHHRGAGQATGAGASRTTSWTRTPAGSPRRPRRASFIALDGRVWPLDRRKPHRPPAHRADHQLLRLAVPPAGEPGDGASPTRCSPPATPELLDLIGFRPRLRLRRHRETASGSPRGPIRARRTQAQIEPMECARAAVLSGGGGRFPRESWMPLLTTSSTAVPSRLARWILSVPQSVQYSLPSLPHPARGSCGLDQSRPSPGPGRR